ncbi:MAG: hypothetical protein LR015_11040 [Verrucomicrobia bacterium]|nr:hypothetical protein [Verrucomicrobiota bacterium]
MAHDNALHAVHHNGEQAVGASFGRQVQWLVYLWIRFVWSFGKITKNELTLALSIPDGNNYPVNLTWPEELSPAQIPDNVGFTVDQGNTVIRFDAAPGGVIPLKIDQLPAVIFRR